MSSCAALYMGSQGEVCKAGPCCSQKHLEPLSTMALEADLPNVPRPLLAGQCTVQCSAADPTACTTNSGKFCANLNTNPNFCGSLQQDLPL